MKYLILLFLFGCTAEMPSENYVPVSKTFTGNDKSFFEQINTIRVNEGLKPLKGELLLTKGCVNHSNYMAICDSLTHDYFWVRYTNSKAKSFGEIVAYGFNTPQSQISAYQNSQSHLSVLINPIYTHIGIASNGLYQCVDLASYK